MGDFEEEFALVFFVGVPGEEPGVEVLELGAEEVEGGGVADDAEDGEEDVVADVGVGGEDVEDGGEDGEGEAGAVVGGGFYGRGEVLADAGEEFVEVAGLADEVDEEVVGCYEFCVYILAGESNI